MLASIMATAGLTGPAVNTNSEEPATKDAEEATTDHTQEMNMKRTEEKATKEQTASQKSVVECPDPSAHHHAAHHHTRTNNALQNQASAAALYSTSPSKPAQRTGINPLGPDGKISSASESRTTPLRISISY